MQSVYDVVVSCMGKPNVERTQDELDVIFPWFLQKSALFAQLAQDIVYDIMRNCDFVTRQRDYVVIRQFDKGDCFYILLRGSVSIFINTDANATDFALESVEEKKDNEEKKELDRSKYGIPVGIIGSGKSFGELALINEDCIRNASIIADEECDLLVVDRELYNRSLKSFQEAELRERKEFVAKSNIFAKWNKTHKRQAAMSLRKETFEYDEFLIEQGKPLNGLIFVLSGQAKVIVDALMHCQQYQEYTLDVDPNEILKLEKTIAKNNERKGAKSAYSRRDLSKAKQIIIPTPQNRSKSAKSNSENLKMKLGMKPIKRLGYVYSEKRNHLKYLETAIVGKSEIFGLFEYGLSMNTYAQSVICTEKCECYILDKRNFERLAFSKKNIGSQRLLKEMAENWILQRMTKNLDSKIPLIRTIGLRIIAERKEELRKKSKSHILKNREKAYLENSGGLQVLLRKKRKKRKTEKKDKTSMQAGNTVFGLAYSAPETIEADNSEGKLAIQSKPSETPIDSVTKINSVFDWETSSTHLNNLENRIKYWYEIILDQSIVTVGGNNQQQNTDKINNLSSLLMHSIEVTSDTLTPGYIQEATLTSERTNFLTTATSTGSKNKKQNPNTIRVIKLKRFIDEFSNIQQQHIVPGKRVYLRPRKVNTAATYPFEAESPRYRYGDSASDIEFGHRTVNSDFPRSTNFPRSRPDLESDNSQINGYSPLGDYEHPAFITSIPTVIINKEHILNKEKFSNENSTTPNEAQYIKKKSEEKSKRKSRRHYTLEEYQDLKDELKRKENQMMHFRASLVT